MLEGISEREKYGLVAAFAVAVAVSFGAGAVSFSGSGPTGAFMEDTDGVSKQQIRQTVKSMVSSQEQRQRQQLRTVAQRNENLTMEDLSINTEIGSVSRSEFGSLYRITLSTTGELPKRTGGTTSIDRTSVMYISGDGRYLFQQPTDLKQPKQQRLPNGEQ
ncbi:MAG: hypothetical protein ABEJ36_03005 [Candidatus Nanosalina sp.]